MPVYLWTNFLQTLVRFKVASDIEWQVREEEPKLFQHSRYPQFSETCIPAVVQLNTERSLSDNENGEARLAAEEACSHVTGAEWEFCIFDVMATGDYGMAATIYGDN